MSTFFVPNGGQAPSRIVFHSAHPRTLAIDSSGEVTVGPFTLRLGSPKRILGGQPIGAKFSYFGKGVSVRSLPTYRSVILEEAYPNVDVTIIALDGGRFEMQFVIRPGGSPEDIRVVLSNGSVVKDGDAISVKGKFGEVILTDLRAYQGSQEVAVEVKVSDSIMTFHVPRYDTTEVLVIDPVITAIVGGSSLDDAYEVLYHNGYVYVAGLTFDFLTMPDPKDTFGVSQYQDVFVSKLDADLTTHIATAIIAGSNLDYADALSVDSSGNVLVGGYTRSSDLASSRVVVGDTGWFNAYITKLSSDLTTHIATVLFGTELGNEEVYEILVPGDGRIIAVGKTNDTSYMGSNKVLFGTFNRFYGDVFVSIFTEDLTTHVLSALVGSNYWDKPYAAALDRDGNIVIAGETGNSSTFAPSRTVFGTPSGAGIYDAFVTKLAGDLSAHIATAIISGSDRDFAYAVALDSSGNVVVGGQTINSSDFAPSRTVFGTLGNRDAFVTKLSGDLSTHMATVILSSSASDEVRDLGVGPSGDIFAAGTTVEASSFSADRVVFGSDGFTDAFLVRLSSDLSIHVATAIFGSGNSDYGRSMTMSPSEEVYVAGYTRSSSSFSENRTFFGSTDGKDAFVVKIIYPLPHDGELSLNEGALPSSQVSVSGDTLHVTLREPGYVGYDLYAPSGEIRGRVSVGYLPPGRYSFTLNLSRGTHLIVVRAGDSLHRLKVLRLKDRP